MSQRASTRAALLLLLTAVVWGFAFVAQKQGMSYLGPFTFNAVRFLVGAALLGLARRAFGLDAALARPGAVRAPARVAVIAGTLLFLGSSLQQVGIVETTAAKAGFITGLYVVFVALLGWLGGRAPAGGTWLGAALGTSGLYLLTMTGAETALVRGDVLVLGCAVAFAVQVLYVDSVSHRYDPLPLAQAQFAWVGLLSLAIAAATEPLTPGLALDGRPGGPVVDWVGALPALAYGSALSVAVGFTLQVVAQRDADPTHASILMSLEAPVATVGGVLLLGEHLDGSQLAGAVAMLAGMLASQLLGRPGRDAGEASAPPAAPSATPPSA